MQVQFVETELPSGEFERAVHAEHVDASVAPTAAENVPISQSVHVPDPASALYFPATQSVHAPPSGPVAPALQAQAVDALLASGAWERAGHPWHTSDAAPTVVEYRPAAQVLQTASPAATL